MLALLEDEFPDWHAWRSDSGHWYATRRGTSALPYLTNDVFMTVDGENPDQLRTELLRQRAAETWETA